MGRYNQELGGVLGRYIQGGVTFKGALLFSVSGMFECVFMHACILCVCIYACVYNLQRLVLHYSTVQYFTVPC